MILNNHIVAIMGTVSSGVAAAEEPLAAQYHLPIMFLTSNDVSLLTKHFTKYAFSVVPNTVMEPRAAADYLKHVAGTSQITLGTISPNYNFGHATVQGFLQALSALGVNYKLASQQWPPLQVTNITPYLSALVSAKPQYVFNGEFGGDLVTFSTQAAQYGFFNHTKMIAMYTQSVLHALGSTALPGTIGFDRAAFWAIPGNPMQTFVSQYKAQFGSYPGSWAVMGYTAVQSWASAVKSAGSFSGGAVSSALSGATVSTIEGQLTFRACDHQANVAEYVGPVASGPTSSTFGERLWTSTFTAKAATIMETCAQSLALRSPQG
jgi:branched-chain amino acid transport system substrate-binding protein